MKDLIDRQETIEALGERPRFSTGGGYEMGVKEQYDRDLLAIINMPSAQSEIIYCKDCKHKGTKNCVANAWTTIFGFMVKDDFYCGLAERRTDE